MKDDTISELRALKDILLSEGRLTEVTVLERGLSRIEIQANLLASYERTIDELRGEKAA